MFHGRKDWGEDMLLWQSLQNTRWLLLGLSLKVSRLNFYLKARASKSADFFAYFLIKSYFRSLLCFSKVLLAWTNIIVQFYKANEHKIWSNPIQSDATLSYFFLKEHFSKWTAVFWGFYYALLMFAKFPNLTEDIPRYLKSKEYETLLADQPVSSAHCEDQSVS